MELIRQKIAFESREKWLALRSHNLNSTDISALFGCSPYLTVFELWNRRAHGDVVSIEETERMKWGSRLESVIAEGVAQDKGWNVAPFKDYMQIPSLRLGSSFDYIIEGVGLMEIKNVDGQQFREKWIDDDVIEAPPHIEFQVQHQMLVSGIETTWIVAFVGGNTVVVTERKYNPKIGEAIIKKAAEFWKSIDENTPPVPDFEKDAEYIIALHNYADPGKLMKATDDISFMAKEYRTFSEKIKELEKQKEIIKAKILQEINDVEKVVGDQFSISAGMIGPAEVSYKREGYRTFKVNWKKEKAT